MPPRPEVGFDGQAAVAADEALLAASVRFEAFDHESLGLRVATAADQRVETRRKANVRREHSQQGLWLSVKR